MFWKLSFSVFQVQVMKQTKISSSVFFADVSDFTENCLLCLKIHFFYGDAEHSAQRKIG